MWRKIGACATSCAMPRQPAVLSLEIVFQAVGQFNRPAALEEIAKKIKQPHARRTLQRRLIQLVAEGRLIATGNRAGTKYGIPSSSRGPRGEISSAPNPDLSLSIEAQDIRRMVSRPMAQRRPVGYDRSFLEGYKPNVTTYLPPSLRRKLTEQGHTSDEIQPAGTYLRKILARLLIDLAWNSSRLEGNTYSLLETQRLFEFGENADGKEVQETQMILNHKAAIELLAEQAEDIGFNRYTLCNLHALLAENLLPDPAAGGRIRRHAVGISGSVFHPLEVPSAIEECFDLILAKASAIENPFEQSFFAMVHLPYLQPFEDVNKRVSRLAANIPLIQRNLGPLSFVDVPQEAYTQAVLGIYELQRLDYLRDVFEWAYERSCARYAAVRQSLGQPDLFRLRYREQLGEAVRKVVSGGLDKKEAAVMVREEAERIADPSARRRFADLVEAELTSLHPGNFARYRLRPAEFAAWQKIWR